ncbi:topoisomerase IV [Caproiciproducens sp. NJN-50]|uniref:DNA gyrase/topoisomerase IV subunit A n=1 Tax=Acutalibacteraceae TaxID=3082771 RepID=UPI000FFE1162|nr:MULTISPECIES: DNA topoisomerase (ATP-hydrolyzing) subunit A [Acutalibacteraceae]QAT49386.1 topoisomerase IV [Caproiciproducens sp. NJN-50]
MPKKKKESAPQSAGAHGVINGAGEVVEEKITDTLEKNYMPYAMSVILSRAIPEIDGFKPSHRKLLYTMYKMGLLGPARTKSANIVGQTMRLNPHGDAAIYDTMVRLSRGYEALLHPYVDSKGNFGKFYSRDMAYAASRYTEARLDNICEELFRDIDRDTVDFVDNYDNTVKEPTLLPATFPTVLVNANTGIAVGMASSICPFNLAEVCKTTVSLLKDQQHEIDSTLLAPDFPGGGQILMDRDALRKIYETGRGSIRIRSRFRYDPDANCVDVVEIPPTTTVEVIVEKVVELVRQGKIREISDIRDETGLDGLKITIDLKRGTDPDKLMLRLFKMTPLEDSFSCNFNVLVNGTPRVMGVRELLNEWTAFRVKCVRRRTEFDLKKKQEKLHLLKGLQAILLDIDKAVAIVRSTEEEEEVVPNLMIGFGIDRIQADYVAEIKLRHLNREYILKRTEETEQLEQEIGRLQRILENDLEIRKIIVGELNEVAGKYGKPRRTELIYPGEIEEYTEEEIPDYPVNLFLTKDGYFKKITPLSLRMGGDQKLKEGDEVSQHLESTNSAELLFFTDRCSVYKAKASDFPDTKASVLGEYIPAKLGMEEGETPVYLAVTTDYSGFMMFFFENGKAAKVDLNSYETKTNRRRLVNAYSDKSPLASCFQIAEDGEFLLTSSQGRILLLHTGAVQSKTTRSTQGVAVMTLRRGARLLRVEKYEEGTLKKPDRYRKTIPAVGAMPAAEDTQGEQLTLS